MTNLARLKKMSDVNIQTWLRKIEAEDLTRAMCGLDEGAQQCILRNMSPLAAQVLKEFVANNKALDKKVIDLNIKKLEKVLEELG